MGLPGVALEHVGAFTITNEIQRHVEVHLRSIPMLEVEDTEIAPAIV